jgi:hypothetical protein
MVLREWGPHAALPQLRQWWRVFEKVNSALQILHSAWYPNSGGLNVLTQGLRHQYY